MSGITSQAGVILLLVLLNGVFAMAEMAIVSARKPWLRRAAEQGDAGAKAALRLAEAPNRFFATAQIGITLIGVLAGAYGGATLAEQIGRALEAYRALAPYGEGLGVAIVVVAITYLSVVLGELVPKRLALGNPEGIARRLARPMDVLALLATPLVAFLGASTDLALRLLGRHGAKGTPVTEDEVRVLVEAGVEAGVFHDHEPQLVQSVLALDEVRVDQVMTPRARVIFLNRADSHQAVWRKVVASAHANFPVYEGSRDNVIGVVSVKAIYAHLAAGLPISLADLATKPALVPETATLTRLVEAFRSSRIHVALVVDEYGTMVGLATLMDVLEAIVGAMPAQGERLRPCALKRPDGSWLIDGMLELDELERATGIALPQDADHRYTTLAGFVLDRLGHLPAEGEACEWEGHRFEVLDMDRQRIDKVLAVPLPPAASATEWPT
jgi:putative hemolysin